MPKSVFLADDDEDDRLLFEDALREVCLETELTTTRDGEELMNVLEQCVPPPPTVIFLDLNMPRKSGFECLEEIKRTEKLKDIPIVIFSTSVQQDSINRAYDKGANHYIFKPSTFVLLKRVIEHVLSIDWKLTPHHTPVEKFLLQF